MKKKILALLITLAVLIGTMGGMSAFAAVSLEECDKCFQTTMNSLLDSADVDGNTITAERKPVYDILLEQLGYVYEFTLAEGEGYAVIICDDGNYVAQEVMPHAQSPYAEVAENELCVFVNNMSYYKAVEGKICAISTGEEISAEAFDFLKENAVFYKNSEAKDPEHVRVVIEFTGEPDEDYYKMCDIAPEFNNGSGLSGACAAVAGGNLIGYFDRYYEDLIPNHEAGWYALNNLYRYHGADTYVYQAINTLYNYMEGTENGINETNFKKGLQKYCTEKDLTCDFISLMSWGKLNYSSVKSSMQNNKPVALFLNTYNNCDIFFNTQKDILNYTNYFGNHVMVGFGYRDINYTLTSGGKSNVRFIYVSTGFGDPTQAYFNIDYSTNIISAYGVNIH